MVNGGKPLKIIIAILMCVLIIGCAPQTGTEIDKTPAPPSDLTQAPVTDQPEDVPVDKTEPPNNDETQTNLEENRIKEILVSMTLEEKLGQLLVVGYPNDGEVSQMIQDHKVGGIVLFSRNYNNFDELYSLTKQLKDLNKENKLPLWIALDEEGGTVSRLPKGKTPIPNAKDVGFYNDENITKATGRIIGEEMAAAGANLDLAPVIDIVKDPNNKLMIKRSYGSTPEMVSVHGIAFLEGLQETGVVGCAKHFPGHGDTIVDSHLGMPIINKSYDAWWQRDAVPFQEIIDAGANMIMIGHLAYPEIDPSGLPASQSTVFMKDILRDRMGFEGIIITDDLEMLGYPQGDAMKEAVVISFLAGVDIFAIGHTPSTQLNVLEALKEGTLSGKITEERIDASIMRIIRAKIKLEQLPNYSLEEAKNIFGSKEHLKVISALIGD